jgi:hypothetical protein
VEGVAVAQQHTEQDDMQKKAPQFCDAIIIHRH